MNWRNFPKGSRSSSLKSVWRRSVRLRWKGSVRNRSVWMRNGKSRKKLPHCSEDYKSCKAMDQAANQRRRIRDIA